MKLLSFLLRLSPKTVALSVMTGILAGASGALLIALIGSSLSKGNISSKGLALCFSALGLQVLLFGYVSRILLIRLAQGAIFRLRMQLTRQILAAPLRQLEAIGNHRLLAALTDDIQVITGALLGIPMLCIAAATLSVSLVYLGWLSGSVLLAVFGCMAVGVMIYRNLTTRALRDLKKGREEQNALFKHYRALIEGAKELKLHRSRQEDFIARLLQPTAATCRRHNESGLAIYSAADSLGKFLLFAFLGVLIFALPQFVNVAKATVTGYTICILYMMAPLEVIISLLPNLARAKVSLQQVEALGLSLAEGATAGESAEGKDAALQMLELIDVSHAYHNEREDRPFRLGPINLSFRPGEVVFLVGGNGSGKTTLAKVLTGLYQPEAGEVRLNGNLISEQGMEFYRQHFSAVFSDFYLFESLLGLVEQGLDERAHDYLVQLHLDHKVEVKQGVLSTTSLSQGQRKRLALLTAYLEDRPFYVFDEWAADQDPVFKEVFYTRLLPDLKGRNKTVLVITHDEKYYALADRVIRLDYGNLSSDEQSESTFAAHLPGGATAAPAIEMRG